MSKFLNKYNYESAKMFVEECGCTFLSNDYYGMNEKHLFRCKCGNEFITTFAKFQNRNKRQCNKCGRKYTQDLQRLDYDYVKEIIESYGCKLLSDEYINYKSKLNLKCICGNEFNRSFIDYKNGTHLCDECAKIIRDEPKMKYTYKYVYNLLKDHNCNLLHDENCKYIGFKEKVKCKCKCGCIYETRLEIILKYNKFTCNSCSRENKCMSIGEIKIEEYLNKHNIKHKQQYQIEECKYKYALRFDFAIFDNNDNLLKLIEFDGQQHFKPCDYFGGEKTFNDIKIRDGIKNEYCKNNNIELIRIPYYEIDNIDKIFENKL